MGNWQTELTFPYLQYNDYSNSHRWFLQCTKVIYLFYSKKNPTAIPSSRELPYQTTSFSNLILSTNENGRLNAPSFSATHFTWKISFPTHFSLTGSWTTTQKLLIGWIEIDSFYPWVPGAQKKPGETFPTLLEDLVMYMKDGREMISLEKMHKKHEKRWQ